MWGRGLLGSKETEKINDLCINYKIFVSTIFVHLNTALYAIISNSRNQFHLEILRKWFKMGILVLRQIPERLMMEANLRQSLSGGAKVAGLHVSLARCSISQFSDDFMAWFHRLRCAERKEGRWTCSVWLSNDVARCVFITQVGHLKGAATRSFWSNEFS